MKDYINDRDFLDFVDVARGDLVDIEQEETSPNGRPSVVYIYGDSVVYLPLADLTGLKGYDYNFEKKYYIDTDINDKDLEALESVDDLAIYETLSNASFYGAMVELYESVQEDKKRA